MTTLTASLRAKRSNLDIGYPGIGSPWRISRRTPLIAEHNAEILCGELALSSGELTVLMENRVI